MAYTNYGSKPIVRAPGVLSQEKVWVEYHSGAVALESRIHTESPRIRGQIKRFLTPSEVEARLIAKK